MRTSKLFINLFLICSSFLMGQNSLSFTYDGGNTWNVDYVSDSDFANFQFNIDGATVSAADGGDSVDAGITSQASGNTVTSINFSGLQGHP